MVSIWFPNNKVVTKATFNSVLIERWCLVDKVVIRNVVID